jgi:predicted secreted acid phosphatase
MERLVARGEAPALTAMRDVYDEAVARAVAVVFITGRLDPRDRAGTVSNLQAQGMGGMQQLVLASAGGERGPDRGAQAPRPGAVAAGGFVIIASVGDQWSDLEGGHAERVFKVPNPFYLIP